MNTSPTTSSMNPDTASSAANAAGSDISSAADNARKAAGKLADAAKSTISDYAANTTKAFKDAVEEQKTAGASAIGDVARAARDATSGFEDRAPQLAGAVRSVADRVENVSDGIRDRTVSDLMNSMTDFASKKPLAFLGCGIVAGLVLSRLLTPVDRR